MRQRSLKVVLGIQTRVVVDSGTGCLCFHDDAGGGSGGSRGRDRGSSLDGAGEVVAAWHL